MSHPFTSPFLALQVPSISSGPLLSNIVSLPNAVRLSGLPWLPHTQEISKSPLVCLDVSSRRSTGGGVLPQITISGQGLQYLFQGLSARGITLQPLEGVSQRPVSRNVSPTPEQASVLLPCNRLDACRPTLLVPELDCVTTDSIVQPGTECGCVTVDSPNCAVPDSLLLDDARVPASQTGVDSDLEMYDSTPADDDDYQPSQVKSHGKAVSSGSNPTETSPAVSGNITSLKTLATETENNCILSHDSPASDGTVDTTLPPASPSRKNMCRQVPEPSADDSDCDTVPQSALVQCPSPASDVPTVASSDLPPETSLGEQMIVSIAKGLFEAASASSKQPAVGSVKSLCTMQDEEAMTEPTNDHFTSSSSSSFALVLAERETKLVQMDESDEELELPAGAPGVVVIPTPPPLPSAISAAKRCLPSAGECTKLLHLAPSLVVGLTTMQLYTVSHMVSASSFTDWCVCALVVQRSDQTHFTAISLDDHCMGVQNGLLANVHFLCNCPCRCYRCYRCVCTAYQKSR